MVELEIVENGTGASITESGWRKFMASVIPGTIELFLSADVSKFCA